MQCRSVVTVADNVRKDNHDVENLLTQGIDVLVIAPSMRDTKPLRGDKAKAQGIPVFPTTA